MRMKAFLTTFIIALCGAFAAMAITDAEVIQYIKQQSALGKSEQQIGRELMAKGVTQEQVKRIKAQYEKTQAQTNLKQTYSPVRNNAGKTIEEQSNATDVTEPEIVVEDRKGDVEKTTEIYGHSLFNKKMLSFEPNENMATPQNYRLGPGDEVIIDIWGESEDQIRRVISPEGRIMVEQLGPIYLNGLTINEANKLIKNKFASKYAGVSDHETDVSVTLGEVRTIQVDIMGEVSTPGTFRLSPFSTVFHALYNAGGINDIGTLRNIRVMRNGRKVATVDIYDYLFRGKQTGNIRLHEGDVIIVPTYDKIVTVDGFVKRPMFYEIARDEKLVDVLKYAGGFSGDAYTGMVSVHRQNGKENQLFNVESNQFATYSVADGDVITVGNILDKYANRVEVRGAVRRPGLYAIGDGVNTVAELIKKADGLAEDAFADRVVIYSEGSDLVPQARAIDLGAILQGKASDIRLQKNDVIIVSSILEIEDLGDVTIRGLVNKPGTYPFARRLTIEDLILTAGGLQQGASYARVEVSRRIVDPNALTAGSATAQSFTFSLKDGLVVDATQTFYLEPYDVVEIRKSPSYQRQQFVELEGEVAFTGQYAIMYRNERITDVIKRAGGVIEGAYVKGARLLRRMTAEELVVRDEALRIARANATGKDSISIDKLDMSPVYSVGINLEKALANPGSTYDIVLMDGDKIIVPQQISTVKISGEVLCPNTVSYEPGKKYTYYIDQAGGYGTLALKSKGFVIYMNGSVARLNGKTEIEPGCHIIIPSKPEGKGTDWTKILSITSSFGSLATMAAAIASLFKK